MGENLGCGLLLIDGLMETLNDYETVRFRVPILMWSLIHSFMVDL